MDERTKVTKILPRWGDDDANKRDLWLSLLLFLYICLIPQVMTQKSPGTPVEMDLPTRFKQLKPIVNEVAKEVGFNPALAAAIIMAESNFKVRAVSPKGAIGLMQVLPSTARLFGVKNPFDPKQNIRAGLLYLRSLWHQFGSLDLALAAYNAGPGSVIKYGKNIPPYEETINYVPKVMKHFQSFKKVF